MLMGFSDPTADPVQTFPRSVLVGSIDAPYDPLRLTGPVVGSHGQQSQCSKSPPSVLSTGLWVWADSHYAAEISRDHP